MIVAVPGPRPRGGSAEGNNSSSVKELTGYLRLDLLNDLREVQVDSAVSRSGARSKTELVGNCEREAI